MTARNSLEFRWLVGYLYTIVYFLFFFGDVLLELFTFFADLSDLAMYIHHFCDHVVGPWAGGFNELVIIAQQND